MKNSKNKNKDKFYKQSTHASMQSREESVKAPGMGFNDSYVPKAPITDSFYRNVSNWHR